MPNESKNPAEKASREAREKLLKVLEEGRSFVLEAGAGAGKTYSLVEALKFLTDRRGAELLRRGQRIACITYTNVASDEIAARTDKHPAILSCTVHAFCWSLISAFQPALRARLPFIANWPARSAEAGGLGERRVEYNLGYPMIKGDVALLGHDDVIKLTASLMAEPKFRQILVGRFPIVLIDEYQDTNAEFAEALERYFLATGTGPLLGFFGDHWQKIYESGCGLIRSSALARINKGANFRSAPAIVGVLNAMRTELPQAVRDPDAEGTVAVYHTNDWPGARRTESMWKGDLPPEHSHAYLSKLVRQLDAEGWGFGSGSTKILMLTHRVLAKEQGYDGIVEALENADRFIQKQDPYIKFLVDTVEPVCVAYQDRQYGEMFDAMGDVPTIGQHSDKLSWAGDMDRLLDLRATGTVGDVVKHLSAKQRPRLPEDILTVESHLVAPPPGLSERDQRRLARARKLLAVPYKEIVALTKFINEATPFSTKHGVKGAEFENVLVVFGRGWAQYDFNKMLEWFAHNVPPASAEVFERNRNLFYVACSRPKRRLALMFTQQLSSDALGVLRSWFGAANIHSLGSA